MTTDLRTVIDIGVSVSAVWLPGSVTRQAFDVAFCRGVVLVSEASIEELAEVLRRPKFDRYVSEQRRREFIASLVDESQLVAARNPLTPVEIQKMISSWNWR